MIKQTASSIAAAILLVVGIVSAALLNTGEISSQTSVRLPLASISPHFRVQQRSGRLALSGHTVSADHETQLLRVATGAIDRASVDLDFIPLGTVPDSWARNTINALALFTATTAADLEVTDTSLLFHGVTEDKSDWTRKLRDLRRVLAPDVVITADVVVVDTTVKIDSICARAFTSFELDPINFQESNIQLRRSALPRLDRLAALASTCPQAQLFITGHTDATGDESQNQQLSQARATAVGKYLVASGIDTERLTITGRGSSQPIATTNTRYGRSQNRRIDVRFGPAAP